MKLLNLKTYRDLAAEKGYDINNEEDIENFYKTLTLRDIFGTEDNFRTSIEETINSLATDQSSVESNLSNLLDELKAFKAKHKLEDFQGAILDYEKAIGIKPFYPDAYSYRGLAYHQLGNFGKAIEDYNKALELDPKNEGVYINRGIARISGKDVDGAIGDYEKALEVNPSSTGALMNRSNAKIIKGDTRGAIQDLNQVITIRPH